MRYPSEPQGLSPLQEQARRFFWLGVLTLAEDADSREWTSRRIAERITHEWGRKTSRSATQTTLKILETRGIVPPRNQGSKIADLGWLQQVPEEFLRNTDVSKISDPVETRGSSANDAFLDALRGPPASTAFKARQKMPAPSTEEKEESLADRLLTKLQKKKDQIFEVPALADEFDVSPKRILEAIRQLRTRGYNVLIEDNETIALTRNEEEEEATVITPPTDERIIFGVLSDTHLCSKFERLDVLNKLYDWYQSEGVSTVLHAGNILEGEFRLNVRDLHTHGMDAQVQYLIDQYPQRPGITTKFITGNCHEGKWQDREGISIGRHIERTAKEAGREDLVYLGFLEHDLEIRNNAGFFMLRLVHPGMGKAYSLSYSVQKIVESYTGGEKPAVLIVGHYHALEYLPNVRGVRVIQAGCTVDQGVFARTRRLQYHLGGWIMRLVQCPKSGACIGATMEDRTFFDKGFYQKYEDDY